MVSLPVRESWPARASAGILLAVQAVAAVVFLRAAVSALAFPYSLEYGEGPLLDRALRLSRLEGIYPASFASAPFIVTNHPPVFGLLQAPLLRVTGATFAVGRALSLLGTVGAAVFLGLVARSLTGSRLAGWIAGLTLLSIPFVPFWAPLCRPDGVALGLACAALWAATCHAEDRWGLPLAGLLVLLAAYTKQSYLLAAPAGIAAFLAGRGSWRRLAALSSGVAAAGAAVFLALDATTGGGFHRHLVTANLNPFTRAQLSEYARILALTAPVLLAASVAGVALAARRRAPGAPALAGFLAAAALSALSVGKLGSSINYFFELAAATSLCYAALLALVRERPRLFAAVALAGAAQALWSIRVTTREFLPLQRERMARRDEISRLAVLVHETKGPVLADEESGLVVLDGRPLALQPFEMTQLARAGVWDQAPLLASIRARAFGLILVYEPPRDRDLPSVRYTVEMLEAIRAGYTLEGRVADSLVLRPKP